MLVMRPALKLIPDNVSHISHAGDETRIKLIPDNVSHISHAGDETRIKTHTR